MSMPRYFVKKLGDLYIILGLQKDVWRQCKNNLCNSVIGSIEVENKVQNIRLTICDLPECIRRRINMVPVAKRGV